MYSYTRNVVKTIRVWQGKKFGCFYNANRSGTLDLSILFKVLISFFGISLISSANYVVNDIIDIDIDKKVTL